MATGTLYLRPSADIFVEHIKSPSESEYAYLLINEEESDGESTAIRCSSIIPAPTSKFMLENKSELSSQKIFITSVMIHGTSVPASMSYEGSLNYFSLEIDGTQTPETSVYNTGKNDYISVQDNNAAELINDYIYKNKKMPNINIIVKSVQAEVTSGDKVRMMDSGVSQLYVLLTYETTDIGIHRKVGGEYKAATSAYRKTNGSWVGITEEECKTILQNSFITK